VILAVGARLCEAPTRQAATRELSLTDYVKIEVALCSTAAVRCLGYDTQVVDVRVCRCARSGNVRMALPPGVARVGSGQSNIRLGSRCYST
jgi:hypothetical protein